jgi:very-short-patch-repair endonuclease
VHADGRIARVATLQEGVISRAQLVDAGLGRGAIAHRVASGSLAVLFRGVFAVGRTAVSARGWCWAALLAVGPDAVLTHASAAYLWDLIDPPGTVEVSLPRKLRRRPGLITHTVAPFAPGDRSARDGLRLTSPLRTLRDLAASSHPALERAVTEAQVLKLVTTDDVAALGPSGAAPTRSAFERAFLRLLTAAGLPQPLVNHLLAGHIRDFVWPPERVVVETDGWGAHGHRAAFESDRDRDAALAALGFVVVRVTWRQLTEQPLLVTARLAQTLSARRAAVPG